MTRDLDRLGKACLALDRASEQAKAAQAILLAAVHDARDAGATLREIAAILECSPETVRKLAA